jgi:hypothetical protein
MTCTHQWHDATTKAGPEWVCAHCKVKYSDTKKAPPAKAKWPNLMRGVRVEGDTVVITVKGGNDDARCLCGELINEMEMNK